MYEEGDDEGYDDEFAEAEQFEVYCMPCCCARLDAIGR